MTDVETIGFETRPRPRPGPDEVLVRVREVGLCGSDVHYFREGRIGDFVVEAPLVLGHECAGDVVEVGERVTAVETGDRVAVEPGVPCRSCAYCKRGEYHLCGDVTFMATPPDDGAFVEYVAWPADFVYPLPQDVSIREGALCEPLSVGIHACRRAGVEVGDTVLITGCGPVGLLAMEAAHAAGAGEVVVSDVVERKLALADRRGAAEAVDVRRRDLVEAVGAVTDGAGVDVAIEASGAPGVYGPVLSSVRRGGTVVCVGLSADRGIPFDLVDVVNREVTVAGSFRYSNTYPTAVDLLSRGAVDVEGIVDAEVEFDSIERAFEASRDPDVVKVMVTV